MRYISSAALQALQRPTRVFTRVSVRMQNAENVPIHLPTSEFGGYRQKNDIHVILEFYITSQ